MSRRRNKFAELIAALRRAFNSYGESYVEQIRTGRPQADKIGKARELFEHGLGALRDWVEFELFPLSECKHCHADCVAGAYVCDGCERPDLVSA